MSKIFSLSLGWFNKHSKFFTGLLNEYEGRLKHVDEPIVKKNTHLIYPFIMTVSLILKYYKAGNKHFDFCK